MVIHTLRNLFFPSSGFGLKALVQQDSSRSVIKGQCSASGEQEHAHGNDSPQSFLRKKTNVKPRENRFVEFASPPSLEYFQTGRQEGQ